VGFRFQKRISILPGVRINLSKSGASASVGPRGADVNIGKDGVTANAGIPGTGLSYRQKAGKGGWLAALLVIGGLAVWAFQHMGKITQPTAAKVSTDLSTEASTDDASTLPAGMNTSANMLRYVHRKTAILHEEPKTSSNILKRELKGSSVTLVSQRTDGWSEVMDGNITGYMRSGALGIAPPK